MNKFKFKHAAALAVCCLFVIWALAGPKEFWVTKPYTEWNAKEVEKLLRKDSPWTRTLLPSESSSSVAIGSTSEGGGGGGSKGGGSKGGGSKGGGMAGGAPSGGGGDEIFINWNSRPIREALVRDQMLNNPGINQAQLDQVLNYKPATIELLVYRLPLGRGRGGSGQAELDQFKEDTFLQKKNKDKIPLADVVVPRGRDLPITLKFAREIDGKPALTLEDKEVTLQIRVGERKYKYTFKLADMVIGDKLEI